QQLNGLETLVIIMVARSEERFSRNAETDLVCRLLLEKKKTAAERIVACMQKSLLCRLLSFVLLLAALPAASASADSKDSHPDDKLVIAQISDTHLGLARAPDAADNLRKVVNMVNDRHPDAVLVTGDIGENPEAWAEARGILQDIQAISVFYIR